MRRLLQRRVTALEAFLPRPSPTVPLIVMADEWDGREGVFYMPNGRKRKSPLVVITEDDRPAPISQAELLPEGDYDHEDDDEEPA